MNKKSVLIILACIILIITLFSMAFLEFKKTFRKADVIENTPIEIKSKNAASQINIDTYDINEDEIRDTKSIIVYGQIKEFLKLFLEGDIDKAYTMMDKDYLSFLNINYEYFSAMYSMISEYNNFTIVENQLMKDRLFFKVRFNNELDYIEKSFTTLFKDDDILFYDSFIYSFSDSNIINEVNDIRVNLKKSLITDEGVYIQLSTLYSPDDHSSDIKDVKINGVYGIKDGFLVESTLVNGSFVDYILKPGFPRDKLILFEHHKSIEGLKIEFSNGETINIDF